MTSVQFPIFVKRDLDGFFGLFIDNLVQLLLIVQLCAICGIASDSDILLKSILPGAAISILLGNLFYAWQAHRLAARENRNDVTALPYGINTPSLLVYIFFVMVPVYHKSVDRLGEAQSAALAWQMGLIACFGSGLIEFASSFVAEKIRRRTPRAALLSTLAGIAIGFISMTFALQIYHRPLVAMLPLAVILLTYFARIKFPLGLPGGLIAVALGTLSAWVITFVPIFPESISGPPMNAGKVREAWQSTGFYVPQFAGAAIWKLLSRPKEWIGFLSVIVPMGLFNVIGSLQNIESAEAAGDRYDTRSSLAVNGLGTIVAALLGSCFPTTIYIGHPGWKGLGARAGYSTLNGLVVVAICLTGAVTVISKIVPLEAGIAIVLWIGIIITAQSFQTTPNEHAPAVALGLFPAIAAWGATVAQGAFIVAGGKTIQDVLTAKLSTEVNGFLLHGLIVMERGYIFTCMMLAAISAFLIDRKLYTAAIWSLIAAAFAGIGLTHAYQVFGAGGVSGNMIDFLFLFSKPVEGAFSYRATGIAIGYLLFAAVFAAFGFYGARNTDRVPNTDG